MLSGEGLDSVWKILAGVTGAIVPLCLQTNLSPRQIVAYAFVGVSAAVFVAPAITRHVLGWESLQAGSAVAWVTGLVAWKLCEISIRWLSSEAPAALSALVRRFTGGSNP
jgi:hypothetical protein